MANLAMLALSLVATAAVLLVPRGGAGGEKTGASEEPDGGPAHRSRL